MLNFAYAEAQELNQNFAEVHATFDKFVDVLRRDLEEIEARVSSANSSFSSNTSGATEAANPTEAALAFGLPTPGTQSQSSSFNTQVSDEKLPKSKELAERRTEYGIAWIVYMRFARRAEGLKTSRAVFGRARRERWTPWEVYEAAGGSIVKFSGLANLNRWSSYSLNGVPLHQSTGRCQPDLRKRHGAIQRGGRVCPQISRLSDFRERRE